MTHIKELLKQQAAYNVWAHQKITDAVLALPGEQQIMQLPSSFSSLQQTLLHLWDAESIWWQRMKLHERFVIPSANFKGSTRDVVDGLLSQSRLWQNWVAGASELAIDHVFQFTDKDGIQVKMPIYQMIAHIFNHASYHRGQLITMLRQTGVTKVPKTDFSFWVRTVRK